MSLSEKERKEVSQLCNQDILNVYWFSGLSTICVALMRKKVTNELRCYISQVDGTDLYWDIRKTITIGTTVPQDIARAIFPQYTDKYAE